MHVRVSTRRNRDGTAVRYLQLTHNEWDPATKTSRPKVLHSFGREDQLDRDAIKRLVASLTRLLDPATALTSSGAGPAELAFTSSRPVGGTLVLDALWRRLGIDTVMARLLEGRKRDPRTERVLFALVANRALDPGSKLAAAGWVTRRAHIDGLPETSDDACYRAMDWLLDIAPELEREVFWQVATLLDHEVDLLFFDTTSTYFETEGPDDPITRDTRGRPAPDPSGDTGTENDADSGTDKSGGDTAGDGVGFRTYGKSKDSRDDLPQVVIGMAVTRAGIPVRVWCWPGNTTDSALIRQAREDMRDWTLARVMWVADRGFSSAANRRELRRGGGHYIIGEKLRSGSAEATAALSRPGRYQHVRDNLQVKEVRIADDERFVLCFNPEQAERDAALREVMTGKLAALIAASDRLTAEKRAELRGRISTMPGLNRYLRTTPGGLLRVDKKKVTSETHLDGKYLLRCSDPHLSAEDIALGYKQLLQVERGWRDMKTTLELRPVYHRLEDRIRAHVILCWLALLLVRIVETTTGRTWNQVRDDLQELHVGTFEGPAGTFRQRTELSAAQRDILTKLGIDTPKKIIELGPATTP
ncbi:IS1634 family transposase [Amycolatopsis sp. K13G38]|uniref:IS1634 family transposase n=1 Tax=Amycolatopsis acididurans TaxID=2724524 RepID=A0ABX1JB57_9PSEU|nr:IS1634 family transposase [Amycolatopsis acididurans]